MDNKTIKKFKNLFSLILIDLMGFYMVAILAYGMKELFLKEIFDWKSTNVSSLLNLYWMPIIYIFMILQEGLYTRRQTFWDESKGLFKAITIGTIFSFFVISFFRLSDEGFRSFIVLFWFFALILLPVFRYFGKQLLYKLKIWNEPLLVMGSQKDLLEMAAFLDRDNFLGYEIVGFVSDEKRNNGNKEKSVKLNGKEYSIVGTISEYCDISKHFRSDILLVSTREIEEDRLQDLITRVQKCSRRILLLPEEKGLAMQNTKLLHMYAQQIFILEINNNLKTITNRFLKKSFDYILAIFSLPVFLPLSAILAVLIKLDSEGPVFFIQERLGFKGKRFKCIKFRTMYTNSDEILEKYLAENPEAREEFRVYKKLRGYDPRVTKMGKFFRKTSLDEIAQIFNVFRGEMSFVGPRPYLPREEEDMGEYADLILETEPGITGLWQVSGRNNLSFEERVKLDVWYVLNWSVWVDVSLLVKTIKVVAKREGAA